MDEERGVIEQREADNRTSTGRIVVETEGERGARDKNDECYRSRNDGQW